MRRWIGLALGVVVVGWWLSPPSERSRAPGVLAPALPRQVDTPGAPAFAHGDFRITPLASFDIEARVLSRENYSFGTEADLSPIDLALGWGPMSDSQVLDALTIGQSGRWYSYSWGAEGPPVPQAEIRDSSANMHMIPADASIGKQLDRIRAGDVVRISGSLVEVQGDNGWRWRSSLTRQDSGGGACELVYVTRIETVSVPGDA